MIFRNFFLIFLLFLSHGCGYNRQAIHTEIECLNLGWKTLVVNRNPREVVEAIENFLNQQIKENIKERYTVLRFRDNSSFWIKNVAADVLLKCAIREVDDSAFLRYQRR